MEFRELLGELNIPNELIPALLERKEELSGLDGRIVSLPSGGEKAYEALAAHLGNDPVGMLACQLMAALITRCNYRQLGIADEVFVDTFRCYTRFLEETRRRTGRLVFDRGWWTWRQLGMKLFRIGALEYELISRDKTVSLHIPSDADLRPESVDRSLSVARGFLERHFPEYAQGAIWCHSWLMSPELRNFLPEGSNIRRFQDRFTVGEGEFRYEDVFQWLFRVEDDMALRELPEETTLQRSVKKHLLAGGKIGGAKGVLNYL